MGGKTGRWLAIAPPRLGKGPDQPVEISRLELVGIACQRRRIADAVIACPALEEVAKGERRESGVAAGAAAADDDAPSVHPSLSRQILGAIHAVVHVYDAPTELKPVTVFASKPGTAAIVDVEHRNTAAAPELDTEIERARGRGGPAAMTFDQQGRPLVGASRAVGIVRRKEQSERPLAAGGRVFHRLHPG